MDNQFVFLIGLGAMLILSGITWMVSESIPPPVSKSKTNPDPVLFWQSVTGRESFRRITSVVFFFWGAVFYISGWPLLVAIFTGQRHMGIEFLAVVLAGVSLIWYLLAKFRQSSFGDLYLFELPALIFISAWFLRFSPPVALAWTLSVVGCGFYNSQNTRRRQNPWVQLAVVANPVFGLANLLDTVAGYKYVELRQPDKIDLNRRPDADLLDCPVCRNEMQVWQTGLLDRKKVLLDICPKCHSIWFDNSDETLVAYLSHIHNTSFIIHNSKSTIFMCPRCESLLHARPKNKHVPNCRIWHCRTCGGHLLTPL